MITLRPATLETVKPLRLRALREDPDSFGSTLAAEQDRPDAEWEIWVNSSLIAFDGDTPVAMASLGIHGDEARIYGMWVAPEARGRRIGEQLLQALLDRAGRRPVVLCVAEPADSARRLYERLGFTPVGEGGTLRPGSDIRTLDLRREPAGATRPPEPSRPARSP